jgi:2-polyprenyl-6-hydroxyphenyl methylase/3-demethylubiquinone-9 3-methyltransferase
MQETTRFAFGRNWRAFLKRIDQAIIDRAEQTLCQALGANGLAGQTFLDLGCGSGLFSLAALRLGARVLSVDLDPESVACAEELKRRFAPGQLDWRIEQGSALDAAYLATLGTFDVVYSWGVLHHTGDLWRALDLALLLPAERGRLYVAIYNDQGQASRRWRALKRCYNRLPAPLRFLLLFPALARIWGPTFVREALHLRLGHAWRHYADERGMHPWRDLVDWVGGYPFEVARPEEVFDFCRQRGFVLEYLKTAGGGRGCNVFVFARA